MWQWHVMQMRWLMFGMVVLVACKVMMVNVCKVMVVDAWKVMAMVVGVVVLSAAVMLSMASERTFHTKEPSSPAMAARP